MHKKKERNDTSINKARTSTGMWRSDMVASHIVPSELIPYHASWTMDHRVSSQHFPEGLRRQHYVRCWKYALLSRRLRKGYGERSLVISQVGGSHCSIWIYDGLRRLCSGSELPAIVVAGSWVVRRLSQGGYSYSTGNQIAGAVEPVEMNLSEAFLVFFVRVRVKHDVRLPLTRFVTISWAGKRNLYSVKYDKLGKIRYACGVIGNGRVDHWIQWGDDEGDGGESGGRPRGRGGGRSAKRSAAPWSYFSMA